MVAVGGEAVAQDLCEDGCTALHGVLILLDDDRRRPAAGNKTIAVAVERTGGFLGGILADGEGADTVKRTDAEGIDLLCAAANDHVLQARLNEQRA